MPADLRVCPKAMHYGPCGGVTSAGACEVGDRPCPFVPHVVWSSPPPVAAAVPLPAGPRSALLVDVRAPMSWHGDVQRLWEDTATMLDGCDALLGEHVDNPRYDDDSGALSPEAVIALLRRGGVQTFATVTGRDRSAADARVLINTYRAAGAAAIHCVTGDHPQALGLDREASFQLESMTLAGLAASAGSPVTVGESPDSPGDRVARVIAKQRAGATVCILNHAGAADELIAFVDACRAAGATIEFIAPVPMVADARSAGALARFPGLRLPPGYLDSIVQATDPYQQALRNAAELTGQLAASGRFTAINLSGSAKDATPAQRLRSTAEFIGVVRAAWGSARGSS